MCVSVDSSMDDPNYMAGLWIIDTSIAQVINRLTINYNGRDLGVLHACVSQVSPCDAYIAPAIDQFEKILVIDYFTGAVTSTIPLPSGCTAEFVYEMPDGNLIVTTGKTGNILIIDPT